MLYFFQTLNNMKSQILSFLAIAMFAVACSNGGGEQTADTNDAMPTACECVDHYKNKDEAMIAKCAEARKAEAFETEFKKCQAAAITGSDPDKVNVVDSDEMKIAVPADGTYMFSAEDSKVMWTGGKITGATHTGTIPMKSGLVTVENGVITNCKMVMDMTGITNTDLEDEESKGKLIGHLMSDDFFSVANNPEATYVFTSAEQMEGKTDVTGDLTIKGKSNPVVSNVIISKNGETGCVVSGSMIFDRTDFDVRYGSGKFFDDLGDNMIKDDVIIKFSLKGAM